MSDVITFNTENNSILLNQEQTYSGCKQDLFVYHILNKQLNGFFVDIGSAHSSHYNNSYLLEKNLNWKGICLEFEPKYNYSYQNRNCVYLNEDATKIDYKTIFTNKVFNLILFLIFVLIIGGFLYYKYRGKLTPEEKEAKLREQKQDVLSRLNALNVKIESSKRGVANMITDLPMWDAPSSQVMVNPYI